MMLISVVALALFGVTAAARITRGKPVGRLDELVVRNLIRKYPTHIVIDILTKSKITSEGAEAIHLLLGYPLFPYVRLYEDFEEGPERLEQLFDPRLLGDKRYQKTLYTPTKILVNPELARALFMKPTKEKDSFQKVIYDGEFTESTKGEPSKTNTRNTDGLSSLIGNLKITEEAECAHYQGLFFEADRLPELLEKLYKTYPELVMRIVGFIIEYQMGAMNSVKWLNFLRAATVEDQLSVIDMLAPREMVPEILHYLYKKDTPNMERLILKYLDERLPRNDLLIRCLIVRQARISTRVDVCNRHFNVPHLSADVDAYARFRTDRSSRVLLATWDPQRMHIIDPTILDQAEYYKLTPFHVERMIKKMGRLSFTKEARLKFAVPPRLLPIAYRPLRDRLDHWLTVKNSFKCVEGAEIASDRLDLETKYFASPIETIAKDDFNVILDVLRYLLADGRQLDCSNLFMDPEQKDTWHTFFRKLDEKIQMEPRPENYCWNVANDRLDLLQLMSLQEFRSLVDSSYREPIDE